MKYEYSLNDLSLWYTKQKLAEKSPITFDYNFDDKKKQARKIYFINL